MSDGDWWSREEELEEQERCDLWHWNNGLEMCDKDECTHLNHRQARDDHHPV
jgi:hypothetical protein